MLISLILTVIPAGSLRALFTGNGFLDPLIGAIAGSISSGNALTFFINLFLKPKKITRHLGKESGVKGLLVAATGGIISTGPIYIWYPLPANLREKGMTNNLTTFFLHNRAVKIPLLPMTVYYVGLKFTITLTALMIAFSVLNGRLVENIIGIESN